jgi:hypothetical protein
MSKIENDRPAWLTELLETTLEFTNVGAKIRIRDRNSRKIWRVFPVFAYALLASSYKDKTMAEPLTNVDPVKLLREEGKKITLSGAFPHKQIVWQQCGFKYFLGRDESWENRCVRDNRGMFLFFVCNPNFPAKWCVATHKLYGGSIV